MKNKFLSTPWPSNCLLLIIWDKQKSTRVRPLTDTVQVIILTWNRTDKPFFFSFYAKRFYRIYFQSTIRLWDFSLEHDCLQKYSRTWKSTRFEEPRESRTFHTSSTCFNGLLYQLNTTVWIVKASSKKSYWSVTKSHLMNSPTHSTSSSIKPSSFLKFLFDNPSFLCSFCHKVNIVR